MASLYTVSVENVKSVAQKNGTQAARYADIRKYMESAEKQSNAVDKKLRLCKKKCLQFKRHPDIISIRENVLASISFIF